MNKYNALLSLGKIHRANKLQMNKINENVLTKIIMEYYNNMNNSINVDDVVIDDECVDDIKNIDK